jgi:chromosome segregation ATPase
MRKNFKEVKTELEEKREEYVKQRDEYLDKKEELSLRKEEVEEEIEEIEQEVEMEKQKIKDIGEEEKELILDRIEEERNYYNNELMNMIEKCEKDEELLNKQMKELRWRGDCLHKLELLEIKRCKVIRHRIREGRIITYAINKQQYDEDTMMLLDMKNVEWNEVIVNVLPGKINSNNIDEYKAKGVKFDNSSKSDVSEYL